MNMDNKLFPVDGRPGEYFDSSTGVMMRDDGNGRLVAMDLGPSDVHVQQALSNFAIGYANAEFIADLVSPPVLVEHQSDKYYIFDPDNELQAVDATASANGAAVPEINFKSSTTPYAAIGYGLAGFLPMEVVGNQDPVVNALPRLIKTIMAKLALNREVRVKAALFNAANYGATHLKALTATQKWNGGSDSDPVGNIRRLSEQMLARATHTVFARETWNAFTENPAVQKYTAFKGSAPPLPGSTPNASDAWAALLDIPKPLICDARVKTSATAYPYVWAGSVALIHSEGPDADGYSAASMKSFRWTGANAAAAKYEANASMPGAAAPNGWTVRAFYDQKRGRRGGWYVVVAHDDADTFITDKVSGLITGAFA